MNVFCNFILYENHVDNIHVLIFHSTIGLIFLISVYFSHLIDLKHEKISKLQNYKSIELK